MDTKDWLIAGFAIALAVVAIVVMAQIVVIVKLRREVKQKTVAQVGIKNGMRYSKNEQVITLDGRPQATHLPKDILLARGRVYKVAKNGKVIPGQYTLLAADDNHATFMISVDGVVQEYAHNSHLVLAEGTEISPRSASVVLR